jgi:hypothetical protein
VAGGTNGYGSVIELSPQSGGGYQEKVIWNFGGIGNDGTQPVAGLIIDSQGHIFGETTGGGTNGNGAVFKLTLPAQ